MTKDDPTIQAVRDARHRISVMVGHEPHKLVERYRHLQERHLERLVSRQPQPETERESVA